MFSTELKKLNKTEGKASLETLLLDFYYFSGIMVRYKRIMCILDSYQANVLEHIFG